MLLCLGACFLVGGLRNFEQDFHPAVSEAGSGLMLVAGSKNYGLSFENISLTIVVGLVVPAVYYNVLKGRADLTLANGEIESETLKISRAVAIVFLVGYLIFVLFQTKSHDGLFTEIYDRDELRDKDRHIEMRRAKLTLTEAILAICISIACVSMIAVFLVQQIPYMVEERHISDAFVGLILVPLVEKAAGQYYPDSSCRDLC
jgi:Ca2+:H+ antiporter